MKSVLSILIAIILLLSSCTYIGNTQPIPSWLIGYWDTYNEEGNLIGSCEIDNSKIEFTINDPERFTFDLMDLMEENFGWTESNEDSYTVFLDYNSWIQFINHDEFIEVEIDNGLSSYVIQLR